MCPLLRNTLCLSHHHSLFLTSSVGTCSRCGDGGPILAELHGAGCPSHLLPGWVPWPAVLPAAPAQRSPLNRSDCRRCWNQQGCWPNARWISRVQWARWTRWVPLCFHLHGHSLTCPSAPCFLNILTYVPVCFGPAVNCVCLAQLLALCGCVAFWQVSHLERSVSSELRRRRGETEEREEKEKGPSSKAKVMRLQKLVYDTSDNPVQYPWNEVVHKLKLIRFVYCPFTNSLHVYGNCQMQPQQNNSYQKLSTMQVTRISPVYVWQTYI